MAGFFVMPIKQVVNGTEFKEGQLLFTPPRVILSSTSSRRSEFIREVFGNKTIVENFGDFGDEPEYDVISVAKFKAEQLQVRLKSRNLLNQYKDCLIVAADTRTNVPNTNGTLDSRGKPKTKREVQGNFKNMRDFAIYQRDDPFYTVSSGAVTALIRVPTPSSESLEEATIILDHAGISYLATDEGMKRYTRALKAFYQAEPYVGKGVHGLTFRDLSAGISLPVLMKLGIVRRINKVSINDSDFMDIFRDAIHTVAIGMPPSLFRPYNTQVEIKYRNWDWLNKVVEKALEFEELYD